MLIFELPVIKFHSALDFSVLIWCAINGAFKSFHHWFRARKHMLCDEFWLFKLILAWLFELILTFLSIDLLAKLSCCTELFVQIYNDVDTAVELLLECGSFLIVNDVLVNLSLNDDQTKATVLDDWSFHLVELLGHLSFFIILCCQEEVLGN